MKHLADFIPEQDHVGRRAVIVLDRSLRVIEHARAETHAAFVALEDVVVDTALTALPEFLIVGKFRECHRLISHA